jgi:hypothetical protein
VISLTLSPEVDDFKQYWQAALNIRLSGDPYATTPEPTPYPNPPLLAYLLQPLAMLDHRPAQWVWFGINLVALISFSLMCHKLAPTASVKRFWGVAILCVALAPPTRLSLQLGQLSILLALLVIAGFAWARRSPTTAGTLLALAGLIKLYPMFVGGYYLFRRRWRVVIWSVTGTIAIMSVSVLTHGTAPFGNYARKVLFGNYYPYTAQFNISLAGFWQRLLTEHPYAVALTDAPWLAQILTLVTSALVALLCVRAALVTPGNPLLIFSAWLCGMLLLSPINGYYNLVLLLFPFLTILRCLELHPDRSIRNWLVFATALICIPPTWSDWNPALYEFVHIRWGLLFLTPSLYGLLIYFVLLIVLVRRHPPG